MSIEAHGRRTAGLPALAVAAACLALPCLAATAAAQRVIYTFTGNAQGDLFGWSVRGAGDFNNDGYSDVVVGAPFHDGAATDAGRVTVYSGRDGAVLSVRDGTAAYQYFGYSVSGAGDVNQDGFDDVVAGGPGLEQNARGPGRALVISGRDSTTLYTLIGLATGDRFGFDVSAAGDVDNDNFPDVIVGAPGDADDPQVSGQAFVFSGRTGGAIRTFNGLSLRERFGHSVAGVGDLNSDGHDEVLVGAPLADNGGDADAGAARLFSGIDGTQLRELFGRQSRAEFGWTVRAAGDVDNDGTDDYVIGARFENDRGRVHVVSGRTGGRIRIHTGATRSMWFGYGVCGPGDVDGDGFADVIIGAPIAGVTPLLPQTTPVTGSMRIYSGRTGGLTYEMLGSGDMVWEGFALGRAGDVNNDGVPDIITASPMNDTGRGEVRVISGRSLKLFADTYSLSAAAGGTQTFTLAADPKRANSAYFLLGSATGTAPPVRLGGVVLPLVPDSYFFTTVSFPNTPPLGNSLGFLDGQARATATFTIPPGILSVLAGLTFHHAYVTFTTGPATFTSASNAVPITFR